MRQPGKFLIPIGWVLIVLSVVATIGILQGKQQRDPSIEAFLTHPNSSSLGGTIGVIIGTNILTLPAMIFGIYAALRKNPKGKFLVITSIILFVVISAVQFLPLNSSVAQNYSGRKLSVSRKKTDSSLIASEIARELRGISKDDVIKEFVEKIDHASMKYISDRDGFSVIFPSKPTLTNVEGNIQTIRNYQAYSDDGLISYNIFFNTLEKKIFSPDAIDALFEAHLAGRLIVVKKSEVLKEEIITYKSFKASRFAYLETEYNPPVLHEGLIFPLDGDSVSLTMVYPNTVVPEYSFDKFLASFDLTPLAPQLKEEPWENKVLGLRINPPLDMDVYKTNNPKTGLIVMFSNKAGHSLSVFDLSAVRSNITNADIEKEMAGQKKDLDGWYQVRLSNQSTSIEMTQFMKFFKHGPKIYMIQGYGSAQTLFRTELNFKKAYDSLTFVRN